MRKAYLKRNLTLSSTMRKREKKLRRYLKINRKNLKMFKRRSCNQTNKPSKSWRSQWGRISHCTILCKRQLTPWSPGKVIAPQSLCFQCLFLRLFKPRGGHSINKNIWDLRELVNLVSINKICRLKDLNLIRWINIEIEAQSTKVRGITGCQKKINMMIFSRWLKQTIPSLFMIYNLNPLCMEKCNHKTLKHQMIWFNKPNRLFVKKSSNTLPQRCTVRPSLSRMRSSA